MTKGNSRNSNHLVLYHFRIATLPTKSAMTNALRFFLIAVVLLTCLGEIFSVEAITRVGDKAADGYLFDALPRLSRAELDARLMYPSGNLGFSLLEPLNHDARCDCYRLTVRLLDTTASQIAHFWRVPRGFYRTVNGPYLELEEFDSLKAITAMNGARLLFAEVGDGQWRCVSIHEPSGNYLLIDYRADGLIERLRDSHARTVVPTYDNGRLVSLTQSWTTAAGTRTQTTLITN
jgi:hypothetical protein